MVQPKGSSITGLMPPGSSAAMGDFIQLAMLSAWSQPMSPPCCGAAAETSCARLSKGSRITSYNVCYTKLLRFEKLRKALGDAQRPCHYLAIPPSAFPGVVEGLGRSGCAGDARVVVEKPFRDEE